jgi:hypothetical protein
MTLDTAFDATSAVAAGDLCVLAAQPVLAHLQTFGAVPPSFASLVGDAAVRLLDTDMIIAQRPERPERPEGIASSGEPRTALCELRFDEAAQLESILAHIEQHGFADHFKPFMRCFMRMMFALFFTPQQSEKARACLAEGWQCAFLMSDAGGPSLASWRSIARSAAGKITLTVDKVWGIHAHREGMAVVAARLPGLMVPAAYLVWPDSYRTLRRSPCGEPFLDGRLQLGNVSGELEVAPDDRLKIGGPIVFNKYLTTVRPFFVRALMAHLGWLARVERVALDANALAALRFLADAAKAQTDARVYSLDHVGRALALKFASNELLASLVRAGAVHSFSDQRDLLAFSKMEGSSYRCYHELRQAFQRHGARFERSER